MRKIITLVVSALLVLFATAVGEEKPWFDMEKCEFCKAFAAEKGLFEHMATEYHVVSNGAVSVTHLGPEFKEAFGRAQAQVVKVVQGMQKGVMPVMCTHCETMGTLFQAGCKQEAVTSRDCIIMIYSSTDTAMIAKIQDFGRKSADALAKMSAAK
jgi:hypothetical protein